MVRKFAIQNSIGERLSLNEHTHLLTTPQGLGYTQANTNASLGLGFYKNIHKEYPARNIVGSIIFSEKPYEEYAKFIDWVNKGYDLMLVYNPNGTEYYAEFDVEYIQKGEINNVGVLDVPVSFYAKTPWYKILPQVINVDPTSGGSSSRFDLTFDFRFSNDDTAGNTVINSLGHLPAALDISVTGVMTDPKITLTDSAGLLIGKMELADVTIQNGSVLRYSSKYLDTGVWIDGVDQLPNLDLSNENFFRVPMSKACTLSITSTGATNLSATINVYQYYRSV